MYELKQGWYTIWSCNIHTWWSK